MGDFGSAIARMFTPSKSDNQSGEQFNQAYNASQQAARSQQDAAKAQADAELIKQRKRAVGPGQTILTGPAGDMTKAPTAQKSLLGQ